MTNSTRNIDDPDIDRALWAAYRCHDKSAVTMNLLRRYLRKPGSLTSFRATWSRRRKADSRLLALELTREIDARLARPLPSERVVFGQDGELLQQWDDVSSPQELAAVVK